MKTYFRLLIAGIAVPVAAIILITAIATGYAFKLAFTVRSSPDQMQIARFAQTLGRTCWTPMQTLLTAAMSMFASRNAASHAWQYGTIVGVVVAMIEIVTVRQSSARLILDVALLVGAGWCGGLLTAWRAEHA